MNDKRISRRLLERLADQCFSEARKAVEHQPLRNDYITLDSKLKMNLFDGFIFGPIETVADIVEAWLHNSKY